MGLENIESWIKDKNPFLCQFAIEAVSGIEDIFEACLLVERIDLQNRFEDQAFVRRWAGFYADANTFHGLTCKLFANDLSPDDKAIAESALDPQAMTEILLGDFQDQTEGMSDAELMAWCKDTADEANLLFKQQLDDLRHGRRPESDFVPENIEQEDTLLFYFKVWLPCWLEYRQYLPDLMAQAVKGDPAAMEKLLRLDRWILEHDRIRHVWQKATAKDTILADDLHKAAQKEDVPIVVEN